MEEIHLYKPAGELEIEENHESDDKFKPLLPIRSKQRLPRWKRTSGFEKNFQKVKPNFRENLSDLEGYSPYQV